MSNPLRLADTVLALNLNPEYMIFREKKVEKDPLHLGVDRVRYAHEEIGDKFSEIATCIREERAIPKELFKSLGIHPRDEVATRTMKNICEFVATTEHRIIPSMDPGVFYVVKNSEDIAQLDLEREGEIRVFSKAVKIGKIVPVALFKVGRKRAQLELIVRRIACMINQQRHVIFGMFAALSVPKLPPYWSGESEMTEELWNGDMKSFSPTTRNGHIVGILQPYISSDALLREEEDFRVEKSEVSECAHLTFLAVILGLRDIDRRNIVQKRFIDVEECFPVRLEPDLRKGSATAAFHLPFLFDDPQCQMPIPRKTLVELHRIIGEMDPLALAANLSRVNKKFADSLHDDSEEVEDFSPVSPRPDSPNSEGSQEEYVVFDYGDAAGVQSYVAGPQSDPEDLDGSVFGDNEEHAAASAMDSDGGIFKDEGGCDVSIVAHEVMPNALFEPNETEKVFTGKECTAFVERCLRLKEVLATSLKTNSALSCLDMVKIVDPFFEFQSRHMRHHSDVGRTPSPAIKPTTPLSRDASFVDVLQALELQLPKPAPRKKEMAEPLEKDEL